MKNIFIVFFFILFPLFVFGQFEWVDDNIYFSSNYYFVGTEENDVAYGLNRDGFVYTVAVNKEGQKVLDYDNAGPDPIYYTSIGELFPMKGGSIFFVFASSDPSGHTHISTAFYDKEWQRDFKQWNGWAENLSVNDSCILGYFVGSKFCETYCWGDDDEIYEFNTENKVIDIASYPSDKVVFSTEGGLELREIYGGLDSIYTDFIFDEIQTNEQGRIVGLKEDSLFLLAPDFKFVQKIKLDEVPKMYALDSNKVAVLSESEHVYLYDDSLVLINDFPLNIDSRFDFIHFNDSSLLIAGNELYGDTSFRKGVNSPFVKEYLYDGSNIDFGQDAGVVDVEYEFEQSVVNSDYKLRLKDLKISVKNFGIDTLNKFNVFVNYELMDGSVDGVVQVRLKKINNVIVPPGETKVFSWSNLYVFYGFDPAGMDLNLCFWTSHPNNHLDNNNSNDIFCENTLVNDKEIFSENKISVFPNPANEKLNIHFSGNDFSKNKSINIYNSLGQLVFNKNNFIENELIVSSNDFLNGIYFVEYKIGEEMVGVERIIVSHGKD